ncbi:uncharacterized protein PHACADRAFT_203255 [Phanerochaete carnosa HHB-10118-sp]|uniref:Uncharacterized protein n=1 Tax=Phanerochaete carnosa (strain HHB-10118-sp) TaxID=650164 RepID=K5VGK0_PHACS|nr:uncharacterized protein PHACADRAFT_201153 [Phanerochaete carnosa HHB-10118-sp]XP_007403350.1 uncharacterized protein PHACADRAFT_203255 [Phanerochaete carnosa HHB-10118-sp]EKM48097.1 hypothetical protein PHACADRAFT_203255 [Phanerochaete carnosa HHB-10118-sp]EKM50313.1 hypothetical protein PHACADRAFT_201153 [Phanerochaete carnosa HHB-10118-sp]
MTTPTPSPRDPCVWGEDVQKLRTERMLDGRGAPGTRAPVVDCPSRTLCLSFAWQEAQVTLIYLIQCFTFSMHDPCPPEALA